VENEFLAPRFVGKRFTGGSIPLEMLRDLAALEDMLVEVAKWVFREQNERQRIPRGFAESIHLRLTGVRAGSAIPVIMLESSQAALPEIGYGYQHYLESARGLIIDTIAAANDNNSSAFPLPPHCLSYFDRLGRSLREGERIEFSSTAGEVVPLTRETRFRLLTASSIRTISEEVVLRGSVHEADQDKLTFQMTLISGHKVPGVIPEALLESFVEAFTRYRDGTLVAIEGVARYDRHPKRLKVIESVERVTILDELDVPARIDDLRLLKDGWMDGRGGRLSPEGLDWFVSSFQSEFTGDLPLPYVYPTEEGGLRLEWEVASLDLSVNIDLNAKTGVFHSLNCETDADGAETLNFETDGWAKLRIIVGGSPSGEAGAES
jgi:hypothetical protein